MAQFNFEGRIENINDTQFEFINKVILEQGIKVKKIAFETVGKAGDNFAANVKRIVIDGEDGNLSLIAKIATQNEATREILKTTEAFKNEHIMYTEFFPKLEQLQIKAGVPKEDRLRYAKCFGSFNEYPHEVILLEDLNLSGFTMLNKFLSLKDDCVRSVLKNIATYHSLSYVLRYREPETFDDFKSKLIDIWYRMSKDDLVDEHADKFVESILSVLYDDVIKNKIKSKLRNMLIDLMALTEFERDNKNSVIVQGDAWTNNFMFRFKEDQLLESIMIDYQLTRNLNPAYDVLFMIFNCTDYETRSNKVFEWIDCYYTELDKSLSYYNLKASSVYPRDVLDEDMKRYANLVFGQSCFASNMLMRSTDESGEMMNAVESSNDFSDLLDSVNPDNLQDKSRKKIGQRITGLVKSFEECNFF